MELIEFVNDKENFKEKLMDKVIIKDESLLHKEICVFVSNDNNQVLLQKRSANKRMFPNKWTLLTGHVELGESFEEAGLREIKEEIGMDVSLNNLHLFARRIFTKEDSNPDVTYFFYTKCNLSETDFIIQQEELSEVKWYSIDEVINMIRNHDDSLLLNENRIQLFEYLQNLKK